MCIESDHIVKTLDKANEWFNGVSENDLPVTINQVKSSNGRLMVKVFSSGNKLIHRRG